MAAQEVAQSVPEAFAEYAADRRRTAALPKSNPSAHDLANTPLYSHLQGIRWNIKFGRPLWPKMECVYFLAAGQYVKIGYTNNLTSRVCDLQGANPEPLRVLAYVAGGRELEREYHLRFADDRHFLEWFRLTPRLQAEIDRLNMTSRESV